jgi:hypothetical protein
MYVRACVCARARTQSLYWTRWLDAAVQFNRLAAKAAVIWLLQV